MRVDAKLEPDPLARGDVSAIFAARATASARAGGTAFPIKGGTYGTQVCFPLPDVERNNNPTLSGKTS